MTRFNRMSASVGRTTIGKWLRVASGGSLVAMLLLASGLATAQTVPVSVTAAGNDARIVVGSPLNPLAEVTLAFADASGLSPASLGVGAKLVAIDDPALLARLPDAERILPSSSLPLLITIEPPASGGLSFRNVGRIEIHTHALAYTPGSSYRLLKAPVGGAFRDVTDEVLEGSVRARGSYGGFSQFLIVTDVRRTGNVVASKIGWLRDRVAEVPAAEQPALLAPLDAAQTAIDNADYSAALAAVDAFSARVRARAGVALDNTWQAGDAAASPAGGMIAGAATLRFSVAYLRDFGP